MPSPIPKAISLSSPKSKIVFEPDRKAIAKIFGEGYLSRLASNSECYPRVVAKAIHQIYIRGYSLSIVKDRLSAKLSAMSIWPRPIASR